MIRKIKGLNIPNYEYPAKHSYPSGNTCGVCGYAYRTERAKGVLHFWENLSKSMAWNTENEDGSMVRSVDEPHQVALGVVGFEDRELGKAFGFPTSRRELLDKLQVKLVVFDDRIEANGLFPIEPINIQLCTSTESE